MADNFTPEQIEQFLQEFFTVVGRRQYIGARYVPMFGRKGESSIEWDNSAPYEPLTVVTYQGMSYTSRTYVPTGIDIHNTEYWAATGNYDSQVEQYREEVLRYKEEVETFGGDIYSLKEALPIENFDSDNTVKEYIDAVRDVLPFEDFSSDNTIKDYIDTIENNLKDKAISGSASCRYLGTIPYLTTAETSVWNHAGSICSNGQYEILISCPIPQPIDNTGIVRFISVKDNQAEVYSPKTIELGHANSITYVDATNEYYIAPCLIMQPDGVTTTPAGEIWVYNSGFTAKRIISAPSGVNPCGVSCDPVTGRIFVECSDGSIYAVIYEIVNDEFVLLGNLDIRSQAGGTHVQDFGVYNNIWYANDTVCNFVYGHINPLDIIGSFDIEQYCSRTGYYLHGEVDGFDFDRDGHLICCADYNLSENTRTYGYVHTIFEVLYPLSTVVPYYETRHEGLTYTSLPIDGNFSRLQQLNPFAAPQLGIPMFRQIGGIFRAVLNADISTGAICLDQFPFFILSTNGHEIISPEIRHDGEMRVNGSGTFSVDKITSPARDIQTVSFGGGVTLNPSDPNTFLNNYSTGAIYKCGGLSNPNNIKFPSSNVNVVGNCIYMVTGHLRTTSGEVAYQS